MPEVVIVADAAGNLPKLIAGFLLLIPGLITDVFAVLLLIPAVQNALKAAMMKVMMKKQQAMMNNMMGGMMGDLNGMGGAGAQGQNPFADMMRQMQDMQNQQNGGAGRYNDSSVIDGEAHEVQPQRQQIELKDVKKN